MNVLEKIFEDIEKAIEAYSKNRDMRFVVGADKMANKAKEIIISHMDEINTLKKKPVWEMDIIHHESYDLGRNVGWNECLEAMQQNTNDGWIPVEERLPEDDDMRFYMCIVENHEEDLPMFCQYDSEYGFGFWHDIYDSTSLGFVDTVFKTNDELGYEKVVAWQPLPEPYKEV